MQTVQFKNGDSMPALGYGTWKLSEGEEAYTAVQEALSAGYRLIDTAAVYGNEISVGKAIAGYEIDRRDIFLTTKLWSDDLGYESALDACRRSLERLGMEYVDLYLIHWPSGPEWADAWRALVQLQQDGLAKHIGVSNFTGKHLEELKRISDVVPEVNQIELHPYIYDQQIEILQYCRDNSIVVEAYSPLVQGDALNDLMIAQIADKYQKTSAQILLRWAIQHHTIPLPKSSHPDRIEENFDIFDFEIVDDDMLVLDGVSNGNRVTHDPQDM
jgi:diketogulonate reductase-like aldo/keto reductase